MAPPAGAGKWHLTSCGKQVGRRISGQVRLALQVADLKAAMERLLNHGAQLVHPPIQTPWGDYNVRLQDPDGMQITLFQKPGNHE